MYICIVLRETQKDIKNFLEIISLKILQIKI